MANTQKTVLMADKAFINGNIYTLSARQNKARAIACKKGKIIAVGTNQEIKKLCGASTVIIDVKQQTVVPGFVDSHCHTSSLGYLLFIINLRDAKCFKDVIKKVSEKAKTVKKGEWIIGMGWNQENWADKKFPIHNKLSEAVPNHPVWLKRIDGHAGLANLKAMKVSGVNKNTAVPDGGDILKDTNTGEPTGLFIDMAMDLIKAKYDNISAGSIKRYILRAQEECLQYGLTELQDAGISDDTFAVLKQLARSGELKLRVYAMRHGTPKGLPRTYGKNKMLTARAVKLFIDGALGSRGAWLLEPYSDRPTDKNGNPYCGLNIENQKIIRKRIKKSLEKGYQICTHAIGDRAVRSILNIYEDIISQKPSNDYRLRVEHAQIIHPDDMPRFAKLGVIASMQPTHATSDMNMAEKRLGKNRLKGAYAWATLGRTGAKIAAGSDFPIESANPIEGFYAAITRQDKDGNPKNGWMPEERMTREQALRAFTIDACYASFEEKVKGTLETGKYADFDVLSHDIMTVDASMILKTQVMMTVINGRIVYQKK